MVRMDVFQLDDHPYYIGCQFHPELKSRPTRPAPLFIGLVQAAVNYKKGKTSKGKKKAKGRKAKKK